MKKILLALTFVLATFAVHAQTVNIPDANFKSYLVNIGVDTNLNNEIELDEAKALTDLVIMGNLNIMDLTGIEAFTELTYFYCDSTAISSIDLSNNTNIEWVAIYNNYQLTSLNLGANTALVKAYILNNAVINSLNVSGNASIDSLQVWGNRQLTTLNLGANLSLKSLYCWDNQLTSLDVSKNTNLSFLMCDSNKIATLDLSKNLNLDSVSCSFNQLTSLNLGANTKIKWLGCYNNLLSSLDVSKNTNLKWLDCDSNKISSIDVSKNTLLEDITIEYNKLTTLNISNNTKLEGLGCSNNLLTALDVSKNTKLIGLSCGYNQLTALDISNNLVLEYLDCVDNQLSSLDISKNVRIDTISTFNNNALTYICVNGAQFNSGYFDKDVATKLSTTNCANSKETCFAAFNVDYNSAQNKFALTVDSVSAIKATSYRWDFGDGGTSTSSAPSHTFTNDGVYNVCMQINTATGDSCKYCKEIGKDTDGTIYRLAGFTMDVINVNAITSIAELNSNLSGIYPNPTSGQLKVVFTNAVTDGNLRLLNLTGQTVLEQSNLSGNQTSLDFSNQPNGLYILEISLNDLVERTKVIKE